MYDDLLVTFGNGICEGLSQGLGDGESDVVFRRTFSALILAECVTRDNVARLLPVDVVVSWADRALTWFVGERDLRGFVPGKGWAHAPAHGGDLIGALARSRHLGATELTVLLDVIADRLLEPTTYRLTHGEDDRLAYATMAILHRNALGQPLVEAWIGRLGATAQQTPPGDTGVVCEWPPAHVFNTRSFLRVLYLQLAMGVRGHDQADSAHFATQLDMRADLLLILKDLLAGLFPFARREDASPSGGSVSA
ncbi:MAG: DUF2785 domain-containing protein [Propionibacteriales bacterium]|nr:DUF2785 domain-containing protein [Propionibacteriales bacterium]